MPDRQPRPLLMSLALFAAAALCSTAAYCEDIPIVEQWPDCDYEKLGKVEAVDGRKVTAGGGGSRKANPARAEKRLQREAEKLGAAAVVLTQRQIQRDGDRVRYVELRGTAIGPCRTSPK